MTKFRHLAWLAAIACGLAGTAHADTATSQLSLGTRFVPGFCLEASGANGAVVISKCNAEPLQAFRYDDTTGQILQGDKCLAAPVKGQPLIVRACTDAPDEKWNFQEDETIKSDAGLCADILNFQRDPGTAVIAWDCTATDNQKFFPTNVRKLATAPVATANALPPIVGTPVIASYFTQGKCLTASGSHGSVTIDNCNRKPEQALHFATGNGGAIVQNGKCLASASKGEALVVTACNTRPEQQWTFTDQGTLRNRDNICADILAFQTRAGTPVIAWDCTATDNQKFYPAVAIESGKFSLGSAMAAGLRGNSNVTTVSLMPGYSASNITGAGGRPVSVDSSGHVTGGMNDTIIVGGAGVLTVRFVSGLASDSIKAAASAGTTSLLPASWSFFSGETAGTIVLQ